MSYSNAQYEIDAARRAAESSAPDALAERAEEIADQIAAGRIGNYSGVSENTRRIARAAALSAARVALGLPPRPDPRERAEYIAASAADAALADWRPSDVSLER